LAPKVPAVLGRRLRHAAGVLKSRQRGAVWLARLLLEASRQGGGEKFDLRLTYQELESRPGTVRENGNLARFWREGLIQIRERRVAILQPGSSKRRESRARSRGRGARR
jgi:hypothetical protein